MLRGREFSRRVLLARGLAVAATLGAPAIVRAQTKRVPITIANAGGTVTLALEELIKRQGYLDEFGIDATFVNVSDTAKIIGSLLGGDTQICMLAGFGQVLPAIERGAKMKVLAGAGMLAPNAVFTAKPEIKTIKDLEGKVIGTGSVGAILHQVMVAVLQKNGVDPSKVRFVNIGTTADIFKAVVAGTVDAGPCNVDVYGLADKFKLHSLGDLWRLLPEYPYQGSFTTVSTLRDKRDALVRTLAAHAKLYRFISSEDSKDAYVAAHLAANHGDPVQAANSWQFIRDNQPYAVNLTIPDDRISFLQQLNIQTGVQHKLLPNADVADMSLATEALKLIG